MRATQPSSKAQDLCGMSGVSSNQMENGNTGMAIVSRNAFSFRNNRGANKGFMWLYAIAVMLVTETGSIVRFLVQTGKQHRRETKLCKITNPHRVQLAEQVITFVLHDPGMKPFGFAVDGIALLVKAGISDP